MIKFDRKYLKGYVEARDLENISGQVKNAHDALENKNGAGSEFTGWVDLPSRIEDKFLGELKKLGQKVRKNSDCIVSIGIGGSYLGIRATVEYLRDPKLLPIYYAGHNMSSDYFYDLFQKLKDKRVTVVVISKSGTTTEPALAFRIVKKFLLKKYSEKQLKDRIICVTDGKKGSLRQIADESGYQSFVIPDDIGGRFSVLTPVGLVPLALAGVDIKELVEGARQGQSEYSKADVFKNSSYQYAASRFLLYNKGKEIEVFASFYDNMYYVGEFWKQLYGESEGKDGKGIFPASVIFSTDLHSMGQWMQEGKRNVFETFVHIDQIKHSIVISKEKSDLDRFNFLAGKELDFINKQAYLATREAHYEGGVPNMSITICKSDLFHLGQLYYFYERAVAILGYLIGINPFNQPGVEAYKSKMFTLLGRK